MRYDHIFLPAMPTNMRGSRPLIPQTATFMRSLAPMIFPDDFVPLIAKVANTDDWAMNFLRVSIMTFWAVLKLKEKTASEFRNQIPAFSCVKRNTLRKFYFPRRVRFHFYKISVRWLYLHLWEYGYFPPFPEPRVGEGRFANSR